MTLLKRTFLDYNRKYFDSRLDTDTIVTWQSLSRGTVAEFDPSDGSIAISRKVKQFDSVWRLSLLHEMAHAATADEPAQHGPLWLKEMRRLARAGAFDRIW